MNKLVEKFYQLRKQLELLEISPRDATVIVDEVELRQLEDEVCVFQNRYDRPMSGTIVGINYATRQR